MKAEMVASLFVAALLAVAGAGYLIGNDNEHVLTSVSTIVGPTITATSDITMTSATTLVSSTTLTQTATTVIRNNMTTTVLSSGNNGWYGLWFLGNQSGCAISTDPPTTWYPTPCNGGSNADAIVFNCLAAAATPQGCTQRVNLTGSSGQYFVITVWYPFVNYTLGYPGINCKYTVPSVPTPPGPYGPNYAYCITISPTAFIVTVEAPPPVPPP
jgi:hypothetical protein